MSTRLPGEFVRGIRLFENLTRGEIQQLLDASEEVSYGENRAIFEEGGQGAALYVIIEGTVRIALAAPSITDTELVRLTARDAFGESSFFHDSAHHASAYAVSPVRLIRLRQERYQELVRGDNLAALKLAVNVAKLLAERLQQTDEWIERMLQGRRDAELITKWKDFRRQLRTRHTVGGGGFAP